MLLQSLLFFFQEEVCIRDGHVTGVQTCALPICRSSTVPEMADSYRAVVDRVGRPALTVAHSMGCLSVLWAQRHHGLAPARQVLLAPAATTAGMLDVFSRTLTLGPSVRAGLQRRFRADRKSTRLNSSHVAISYAVFCLKKKIE